MKFYSHKFHISHFIALIYPKRGLGIAKLFVGMASNDETVNNKATCNNIKQVLQASSLVIKLI